MQLIVDVRYTDGASERDDCFVAEAVSSAVINQLLAGEIGPSAVVGVAPWGRPYFDDSEVVSWSVA